MPDGSLRLYYVGTNECATGFADELAMVHQIGPALSDESGLTRWGVITARHEAEAFVVESHYAEPSLHEAVGIRGLPDVPSPS